MMIAFAVGMALGMLIIHGAYTSAFNGLDDWGFNCPICKSFPQPQVNTTHIEDVHDCDDIALETEAWFNQTGHRSRRVVVDTKTEGGWAHMINILEVPYSNGVRIIWEEFDRLYEFRKDNCRAWRCLG